MKEGVRMEQYSPPFNITNGILSYVSSISEKIGEINFYHDLENKPHLRRNNKIKSVHASLKIEANSLSMGQVRDVINGKSVLGNRTEIQEVKNAYEAYDHIKEINPLDIQELMKFHGIMTKYIVDESGTFRQGEEGVFNGDECIFMAPPARLVPGLMKDLFEWMKREYGEIHPLIMAAVFHYEFVFIHPFVDGNGRMARLWHTAILMNWKPIFEYIPLESQIEKFQNEYYKSISDSHIAGESTPFIEFILEQIDHILDELVVQVKGDNEGLSEYVRRLLEVMEYDISYTANEIMEKLGIKSKENFRKNYINPALSMGMVEMTIPDKRNSKNQRYIKR